MKSIFYLDGKFVEAQKAKIPVFDIGFLRGYGVFDFLRTYNKQPFYLKEHLQRLLNSARLIGLKHNFTIEKLEKIVLKTLKKNKNIKEANIRIILTGGDAQDFITPTKPRLIVMITPLKRMAIKKGKLITKVYERTNPLAKTLIYTDAVKFLQEAKQKGALEVLFIKKDGEILECSTSNFFAVIKGKVITPPVQQILTGITRKIILDLCKKYQVPYQERKIYMKEIKNFDECFITASNKEILPIYKIDNIKIQNKSPESITEFLISKFKELTQSYKYKSRY